MHFQALKIQKWPSILVLNYLIKELTHCFLFHCDKIVRAHRRRKVASQINFTNWNMTGDTMLHFRHYRPLASVIELLIANENCHRFCWLKWSRLCHFLHSCVRKRVSSKEFSSDFFRYRSSNEILIYIYIQVREAGARAVGSYIVIDKAEET